MIEIQHVTKIYPKAAAKALDDVSLTIPTGAFFGLLGPNGAGKTTLISILSTLLLPTQGEVRIDGQLLTRQRGDLKQKMALITQHNSLRNDMTLDETMELHGRLYGMDRREIRSRGQELLEFGGLAEHRKKTVRKLSGGMKRNRRPGPGLPPPDLGSPAEPESGRPHHSLDHPLHRRGPVPLPQCGADG